MIKGSVQEDKRRKESAFLCLECPGQSLMISLLNQYSEFYFSLSPKVGFFFFQSLTNAVYQDLECVTVLPFHTVHGVINERILKWFAI